MPNPQPEDWSNLDGGRFLADLYAKDSIQATFIQKIINAVNKLGSTLGANPVGNVQPPPPIDNVNVSTSGEMMQVTLNHNRPVSKAISYFLEVDNSPNFPQPQVKALGPSRSPGPFPLPTLDQNGKTLNYYVRAYAQYPGSKPSTVTTFGGSQNPASITMGGTTSMTVLASTGSGTASPTGQQGGSGFGKVITQPAIQGAIQRSVGAGVIQSSIATPPIKSTGDGLIHGETPWESDPSFVLLRDDFVFGAASGTNAVGELKWNSSNTGVVAQDAGFPPHPGIYAMTSSTTANNTGVLFVPSVGVAGTLTGAWALFDYPFWKLTWIFQFVREAPDSASGAPPTFTMAKKSFYAGLFSITAAGAPTTARPGTFCGLRYDTDTTSPSIGDTTFHFEAVANQAAGSGRVNTQGTVINTAITPIENDWYRFEMLCTAAGQVVMSLTDTTNATAFTSSAITMPSWTTTVTLAGVVNGLGVAETANTGANIVQWVRGSKVTISGTTVGINGLQTVLFDSLSVIQFPTSSANTAIISQSGSMTGFPAVSPFIAFGNDSEVTPQSTTCAIDFFSFIWNPGVGGGTATPNPNISRYFGV